jgi:hypothetical protein
MLGTDIVVPLAFFAALVVVILGLARTISEGRTRRRLIESGGSPEVARALSEAAAYAREHPPALLWGIVAIAAGAAFVALQFLPFDEDDPIMAGVLLLFVGAGLLLYHRLTGGAGAPGRSHPASLPPAHPGTPGAGALGEPRAGEMAVHVENRTAAPTPP